MRLGDGQTVDAKEFTGRADGPVAARRTGRRIESRAPGAAVADSDALQGLPRLFVRRRHEAVRPRGAGDRLRHDRRRRRAATDHRPALLAGRVESGDAERQIHRQGLRKERRFQRRPTDRGRLALQRLFRNRRNRPTKRLGRGVPRQQTRPCAAARPARRPGPSRDGHGGGDRDGLQDEFLLVVGRLVGGFPGPLRQKRAQRPVQNPAGHPLERHGTGHDALERGRLRLLPHPRDGRATGAFGRRASSACRRPITGAASPR